MTLRRFLRVAGVLLLVIPFLPLRRMFGEIEGAEAWVPPSEWLLGLVVFGTVAWLGALALDDRIPPLSRGIAALGRTGRGSWVAACAIAVAGLLVLVSLGAFGSVPLHVDSVAQLFQARIFATGALAAPPPPEGGFFVTQNMLIEAGAWYSQYPPGHPAVLTLGALAGQPWVVPVLLSLGSAVFLFLFARLAYGEGCGRLTLLLAVLCPFFWFMGASFMNHVSALFFVSMFLYLFARWEEERSTARALAVGAALGAASLVRPLTAVAAAVVFAGFGWSIASGTGIEPDRGPSGTSEPSTERGRIGRPAVSLLSAGLGFAAVASLYLLFNGTVTGDPFLPGYLQLWGESHGLGFHETPWGGYHTPWTGLRNELVDLSLLNLFLFEWPVPALLPVGVAFAAGWMTRSWDRRLLLGFLALPAAYLFYWHRDAFLGPRFLYAGVAFLLPLTARSLMVAGRELDRAEFQIGSLFRPVGGGRVTLLFVGLCFAYSAAFAIPRRFHAYASSRPGMKVDLRRRAAISGIEQGLIFVKVSWGNRLLARLRGNGVSAATAIQAYRSLDHCDLHELVESASRGDWPSGRLSAELERRMVGTRRVMKTARLNGDPTLRLRPGRSLPPTCREEIRYDRRGYTNYTPFLTVNRPTLDGELVVARDLRGHDGRLVGHYPEKPVYLFDGDDFVPMDVGDRPTSAGPAMNTTAGGPRRPRRGGGGD